MKFCPKNLSLTGSNIYISAVFVWLIFTCISIIYFGILYRSNINYTGNLNENKLHQNKQVKVIICWFHGYDRSYLPTNETDIFIEMLNGSKCQLTRNRRAIETASVVLFPSTPTSEELLDLPHFRAPWQIWADLHHTPPTNKPDIEQFWTFSNNMHLNWTISYIPKAHLRWLFGSIRKSQYPMDMNLFTSKIARFRSGFAKRQYDAVLIATHCGDMASHRMMFVDELRRHGISVAVYGGCGPVSPDREWELVGEPEFFAKFRFHLAFENSICEHYISEKAYHAFYANYAAGTIPVVLGGGNYSISFPDRSYLNALEYQNISDLVNEMKQLSKGGADLVEFYQWQRSANPIYELGRELKASLPERYDPDYPAKDMFQNLCKTAWNMTSNEKPEIIKDMRELFGHCREPKVNFD